MNQSDIIAPILSYDDIKFCIPQLERPTFLWTTPNIFQAFTLRESVLS